MYKIIVTQEFEKDLAKLDNSEKNIIQKILKQIKEQGDCVGKPLAGLSFFREKKFGGKRLYYLIYKEFIIIFILAISDKKAQQATINKILANLAVYHKIIHDQLDKRKN